MNRLILAVLLLPAACGEPAGSRKAPALALPDLTGKTVSLSDFRGHPVLLNFWATWCDTCHAEMPQIEELYKKLASSGVVILGVSMDDDAAKVPPFAREHKLTFPLLISHNSGIDAWAVRGLPTAFLIDGDGVIARRWVGALDARAAENDILALLNRRPQ